MKWELETGIRKKFHLKFPTVSFCCSPSSLYHSFLIIVIVLTFYSVISIFYLLNFTLSPNKTFQINFSNSFHPTTAQFLSGTFAKSLLDVVGKLGKRDLYPLIPSQLQLLILVLFFFSCSLSSVLCSSLLLLLAWFCATVLRMGPVTLTLNQLRTYFLLPLFLPISQLSQKISQFYLVTKSSTYNSLIIISKSLQEYRMIIVWSIATINLRLSPCCMTIGSLINGARSTPSNKYYAQQKQL